MRLNDKFLVVFILFFIFTLSAILIFGASLYLEGYQKLDERNAASSIENAMQAVNASNTNNLRILTDWADWDDTYDYVRDPEHSVYIERNLLVETFSSLHITLFTISDLNGNVIWGRSFNETTHTLEPLPPELLDQVDAINRKMNSSGNQGVKSGIIMPRTGPMAIATAPILHTDGSGPVIGRLTLGSVINAEYISQIGAVSSPTVAFLDLDDRQIPDSVRLQLLGTQPFTPLTHVQNDTSLKGYVLLDDIYDNPALIVTVDNDRGSYRQGRFSLINGIFIILGISILAGMTALVLIDRYVLRRLRLLREAADEIRNSGTLSGQVDVGGDDELTDVAVAFNQMIRKLGEGQKNLGESEKRFRDLSDLLPQIIFEIDGDGNLTYFNRFALETFGISEADIASGISAYTYIHPDDRNRAKENLRRILEENQETGDVYRLIRKDGKTITAIIFAAPILREGKFSGFRGSVNDITELKEMEQALSESRDYLNQIFSFVQSGIMVIDAQTHIIIDVNPAAVSIIGAAKEAVIGKICHKFICPTNGGLCPITDLHKTVDNAERLLIRADGTTVPVIKYVTRVRLYGRDCLLESFIDNSERKRIEKALRESEEKFRNIAENTADVLFALDIRGRITYISPQVTQFGFNPRELLFQSFIPIIHPEDRERVAATFSNEMASGTSMSSTFRIIDRSGFVHWIEERSNLLYDPQKKPVGLQGVIRDITDRKKAEDTVRLANRKLNLLNDITRHDIINTLTGLLGTVDMTLDPFVQEDRNVLLEDIRQAALTVQKQIEFTREYQAVGIKEPVWQNVRQLIQHAAEPFAGSGITIINDITPFEVFADPLLEKVFYNLIQNAVTYGKSISRIRFTEQISDRGFAIICEDDGSGIPPGMKEKVFERGIGQHTGMGLFLSREIAGITGITIRETGIYGKGARFEILIPKGGYRFPR